MSDVEIYQNNGGRLAVKTPYHPDMPARFRALGGKWQDDARVWTFDIRDEARVRAEVEAVFGSTVPTGRTVTLRWDVSNRYNPARLAGRVIAERRGRDAEVRLGDGVVVVEGKFPHSGGSAKYPALWNTGHDGVVVEIRDVDEGVAAKMVDEGAEIVQ